MSDVKMKGFMELVPVDKALNRFLIKAQVHRLPSEMINLCETLGRVLAEDVVCPRDVPPFDRSAVDGYALRAEDVYGTSPTNPVVLSIVGSSRVGVVPTAIVGKQQTMSVATGAPIPEGSDSVVMVEYTERTGLDKVEIYRPVSPGENVSRVGEDVRVGELILRTGTVLKPQDIGIVAALGIQSVRAMRKPRISVLSTGDELCDLGTEAALGKIIDSNRPTITAMVTEVGGEPIDLGIAPDEREEISRRLKRGLDASDLVLVTGATSVGEYDLLPSIVNSLGSPGVIIHGIAMRPGRPTALCAVGKTPVVLLPGFPVAAMIAFETFVSPLIQRMLGIAQSFPRPTVRARALRRVASSLGNRTYARVLVRMSSDGYVFEPLRTSGSGVISSMVKANGMIVIPENKEGIEEGETVEVTLLRPIGG